MIEALDREPRVYTLERDAQRVRVGPHATRRSERLASALVERLERLTFGGARSPKRTRTLAGYHLGRPRRLGLTCRLVRFCLDFGFGPNFHDLGAHRDHAGPDHLQLLGRRAETGRARGLGGTGRDR